MNSRRNIIVNIIYIVIGVSLLIASKLSNLNSLYMGFGGGMIAVGVLQLIRAIRYSTDTDYKEKVDVAVKDERNSFIRTKAWSWTGYAAVIISAIAVVICLIMGLDNYVTIASMAVCGLMIIYLIAYTILKNRY